MAWVGTGGGHFFSLHFVYQMASFRILDGHLEMWIKLSFTYIKEMTHCSMGNLSKISPYFGPHGQEILRWWHVVCAKINFFFFFFSKFLAQFITKKCQLITWVSLLITFCVLINRRKNKYINHNYLSITGLKTVNAFVSLAAWMESDFRHGFGRLSDSWKKNRQILYLSARWDKPQP